MLWPARIHSRECAKRDEKPASRPIARREKSSSAEGKKELFKNERTGNFYENKGALWKTRGLSGKFIENKGAYGFNPRILQKTKEL
jgi:hypothetical protein